MRRIILSLILSLSVGVCLNAQTTTTTSKTSGKATAETAKKPIFRVNKEQITQAQKMLKAKRLYSGEESGKYSDDFRASVKKYQSENGLKATGSLNRATLEKMGIELTDAQKAIPVSPDSFAAAGSGEKKPRGPVFRATKEQIIAAQKVLKTGGMYAGEETGKLDDETRAGLKKYQEAKGLKVTGTLNQITLEKMGIDLTDKQKENAAGSGGSQ